MKDPSLVDELVCTERLVLSVGNSALLDVSELHFCRQSADAAWRIIARPKRAVNPGRAVTLDLDYRSKITSGVLPTVCSIVPDSSSPLRTAKIHATLRKAPLEAMLQVQDIMCHLILFECRECRVRFPAFHPDFEPPPHIQLQVLRQCPNAVAEWNERPSLAPSRLAPRHGGLCCTCADDLRKKTKTSLMNCCGVCLCSAPGIPRTHWQASRQPILIR